MSSPATANNAAVLQAHRKQANLKLLQRTCRSTITDIYVSATHVVLYEYRSSWHKTTQEGTLFVVQEDSQQASLILLNRHSTDNFEVNPLTQAFQVQQQEPFLMFKHDDRVWGLWFHSAEERQAVFDGLQQVLLKPPSSAAVVSITTTATATTEMAALSLSSSPPAAAAATSPASPVALDKKALQLALLSLMQDDRFLTLLHQQYLKVIRTKSSSSEEKK